MDLAMVPGGGALRLRGSEEAGSLVTPTTLTGSVDEFTGAVSGASFSTPPLAFAFPITSPLAATVYVDAVFTEVTPGSVTGSVTKVPGSETLGTVNLTAVVKADLHIEVQRPNPIVSSDCTTPPITLRLSGTYDKTTQRVTLVDANFSVAPVPVSASCQDIVASGVNERLAGAGHAISLAMQGPLFVPEIGTAVTTTSLVVAPPVSKEGGEVTLTASVTPTLAGPTPTGFVELRDGDTVIGTSPLDGTGTAALTTTGLSVGLRQLSAVYRGDATYGRSTSPTVEHLVAATPKVAVAMGSSVLIGGQPRPATITVTNPSEFGADVNNARLAIRLARTTGTGQLNPNRIKAEWLNGATWEPVPLVASGTTAVTGVIGATTGFPLPAGTERKVQLRISAFAVGTTQHATQCLTPHPTCPGPVALTATVQQVDPGTSDVVEPVAEVVHDFGLVETVRRSTTFSFSTGFPRPHTVRQGYTVNVAGNLAPAIMGLRPTGSAEILLDGERVAVRPLNAPLGSDPVEQVPVINGSINGFLTLSPDMEVGTHIITARYSGNAYFLPLEATTTFTVLPAHEGPSGRDLSFVCAEEGFNTKVELGTNVQFDAVIPATVASGVATEIDVSAAVLRMNRQHTSGLSAPFAAFEDGTTTPVGTSPLTGITFDLGDNGSGAAQAMERQGGTIIEATPNPATEATVDQTITLHGPSASITVEGEPGEVVPIELERITLGYVLTEGFPVLYSMTCTPVGGPAVLGEVVIAGTRVSVDPVGPVRENVDAVTITAETFPSGAAGTVSFSSSLDGSLGSPVAVDDGEAVITVGDLSVGTHVVTAAFNATDPNVPDTAGTVSVVVLPEFDCPSFAQAGNAAVVRLVYLELLGRCPDAAGFGFWKGRLDGGTSPEVFARSISRTPEAVGRVVDDAYVTMLGRPADAAGRVFWTNRLLGHGRYDALLADLGASAEFWAKAGSTNAGFVTRVYEQLLDRSPDQSGQDFWVGRLDAGTSPRVLILQLANLDEPLGVLVTGSYREILDRAPNAGERTGGIAHLRATGDRSGLYARLIGTAEFRTRAQSFPNPET